MHLNTIFTASLLVSAPARGGCEDSDFSPRQHGQIAFVSSNGELDSDPSLIFDEKELAVKMDKFSANTFIGDSINFRGREIVNAALVDSTIEGIRHLTVDTLALRSQASTGKSGFGLAIVNSDGTLSTTGHLRWDDNRKVVKVSSLEALGGNIAIESDVDLNFHTLRNAELSAGTVLNELNFENGRIENSVLHNVTATGLTLKDVRMDSLAISEFNSKASAGSILIVGEDGAIKALPTIKQESEDRLQINSKVILTKPIDLNGQEMTNAKISSGTVDGPIDITANYIKAKGVSILDIQQDKTVTSDGLAVLGLDGTLQMGPISIDRYGALGDVNVKGTVSFAHKGSDFRGRVKDADIVGGTISEIEKLHVIGGTTIDSGLHVAGDTYIDSALTVSGSVFGSGPYVDVSDKRFKRNIEKIDSADALEKILQLEGVSYDLDLSGMLSFNRLGNDHNLDVSSQGKQIGFIAQDVERVIPELVYNDKEGWKGLHYSRLAPVLVESLKQITAEVRELKETLHQHSDEIHTMRKSIWSSN
eukprot:CCRYP_014386-RA/>CCRYP_014386-RA protein AED:0.42 eAED:0.41 QI:0/-1/0/1/-1/1/1/0/533